MKGVNESVTLFIMWAIRRCKPNEFKHTFDSQNKMPHMNIKETVIEGFELGQWPPTAIQENYKSSLFLLFLCHDSVLFHLPLGNCLTPKKVGPCKGAFPRWNYNGASSKCEQFVFGGCKANNNNYLSEEECLHACKNIKGNAHLIVLWQCCTIGL